jgi:hypothetical protein
MYLHVKKLYSHALVTIFQERERVKSMFEPAPYNDNEEIKCLLEAFQKFVLHGDPNRDDGLYSLPHRAYKAQSRQANTDKSSEEESGSHSAKQSEVSQNNESGEGQVLDSRESQDVLNQNSEQSDNRNQTSQEQDNETVNQNQEVQNTSKI